MKILTWIVWLTDRKVLDMCNNDIPYEDIEAYAKQQAFKDLCSINNFVRILSI